MDKLTVTGLVLRAADKGENDRLITMLTAERGKLIVLGKGVRSLKNPNMAATQQFCYASFVLYKSRGGMYYISESELAESFYGVRSELCSLALASYVTDVADHCSVEESEDVPLLRLTLNTLYAISTSKRPLPHIKAAFELRCASVCGFTPELSACAACGADDAEMYYLDILGGELFCPDCMASRPADAALDDYSGEWTRPLAQISPELLRYMRYTVECDPARILSFTLPEAVSDDFSSVCERYLLHHLGRGFKTLDYYKQYEKLK